MVLCINFMTMVNYNKSLTNWHTLMIQVHEIIVYVLFHLLSQQQTRISCDRYMIVVKETEIKCM